MKKILMAILLSAVTLVRADDLSTRDGTVYRNVTIISSTPERMLIVHDGGGCQVEFKDLKPDSLTAEQRKIVEEGIRAHVAREERREKIRLDREAYEMEQRDKGLIEFEGNWVTPVEREEILATREKRRLETERLKVQLAQDKAQLEREKLETEKARQMLKNEQGSSSVYVGYTSSYRSSSSSCWPVYVRPGRPGHHPSKPKPRPSNPPSGGHKSNMSSGSSSSSISPSAYNRGPFNRYGDSSISRGPFNRYAK